MNATGSKLEKKIQNLGYYF